MFGLRLKSPVSSIYSIDSDSSGPGPLLLDPASVSNSDSPNNSGNFYFSRPYNHAPSALNAPVRIDVGGVIYTSSLETLTSYPESRLSKMFSGAIPIGLDSLNQHYFIDRDGGMFRHILNFLRNKRLLLPFEFPYLDLLHTEAEFFELHEMVSSIMLLKKQREDYDWIMNRESV